MRIDCIILAKKKKERNVFVYVQVYLNTISLLTYNQNFYKERNKTTSISHPADLTKDMS